MNPFAFIHQMVTSPSFIYVFKLMYDFAPIWLPLGLGSLCMKMWRDYIETDFIIEQGGVLLEIKLPIEITRSPLGIEIFLTALHQKGSPTYITTYWEGKVPPWFSLEIVSIDGQIRFFVWCWSKFKNIVEAQLYAHYQDIEIYEVPDYTLGVNYDSPDFFMWGTNFNKSGKEGDVVPIKSYIDYELDKADTEEEFKTDPMTSVLEFMGSIKKGEQIWIQILIQAHKKYGLIEGKLLEHPDWKEKGKKLVEKIRNESGTAVTGQENQFRFPNPTKGQQEKIAAIERGLGKYAFNCCIRGMYITTGENLDTSRFPGLIGSFRQYSSNDFNALGLGQFTDFDYPWQDFNRIRRTARERGMLKAYKMRSFFHAPFRHYLQRPIVMTTEELATIWHFPGRVAATPTLARIVSKKAEAPPNLPI